MIIKTSFLPFNELSLDSFYELLALRASVFIVEQRCPYQDLDYKDQNAVHVLMQEQDRLIAYARILSLEDNMSFGRLLTAPSHRAQGLGKQLMDQILSYLKNTHPQKTILIHAQQYLASFYQSYGFQINGEPFNLDGIMHLHMEKRP